MKKGSAGVLVLGAAVLFLSGCGGSKTTSVPDATQNSQGTGQSNDTSSNDAGAAVSSENLPPATGKVDDTVNAIVSGAGKVGA